MHLNPGIMLSLIHQGFESYVVSSQAKHQDGCADSGTLSDGGRRHSCAAVDGAEADGAKLGNRGFLARSFLVAEALRDLGRSNPTEYHHFLWANHVGGRAPAKTYDISNRFGDENHHTSRRELFEPISL